jgi:hypothetical protein
MPFFRKCGRFVVDIHRFGDVFSDKQGHLLLISLKEEKGLNASIVFFLQ